MTQSLGQPCEFYLGGGGEVDGAGEGVGDVRLLRVAHGGAVVPAVGGHGDDGVHRTWGDNSRSARGAADR